MKSFAAGAILAFVLAIGAGMASIARAGTVDGSLIFATEPVGGFDSTVGIGIGGTFDVSRAARDVRVAVRADMSYFEWDGGAFGVDLSYSRLMFFGGPRFYFGGSGNVAPYLEGGLELSFDEFEYYHPVRGKVSGDDTSFGLAGGGGIEIALANRL